ncbi:hypothetical protein Tco_1161984 [Tanacetum coccineum]
MMDVKVQHEDPSVQTSPLLTVLVFVILESSTAPATTITSLLSSLFPNLQQSTPTNIEATTSTPIVLEFETLNDIHFRVLDIEKEVKELKNVDHSLALFSTIKSKVPNTFKEYIGTSLDDALYKVLQKHSADIVKEHSILAKIIERLRLQYIPQKSTNDIRKIKMEHASKQQVPKSSITSSDTAALDEFCVKDQVVEPISVQDSDNAEHDDAELDYADMQMDQGEDLGNTDEQPNDEAVPKKDWYKKSSNDISPDPEWNEGKLFDDGPEQSWLNDMAKATKPPLTFDEPMHTPIDFSAFAMNRLKIDNLTKELLVGPVYNLLKGTCKSYVELEYTMEECYRALFEQLDWNNPEGHRCPYYRTKPLPMQMSSQCHQFVPADFFFNNDLKYLKGGSNDKKYTASTTKSKATRYALLGISYWRTKRHNFYGYTTKMVSKHNVYSTKRILSIISVKVNEWQGLKTFSWGRKLPEEAQLHHPRTQDVDMSCRPAYTTLSNPQGVIYEDNLKRKRFIRAEELHKFSDGTLISVRDTMSQMLHELHLGYYKTMRRRQWTILDQQRTRIMIKAINQKLLDKRIMRSLEKFVGGREYGEDL